MKDRRKLHLKEINEGKQFVMPIPTVRSYEKYLAKLAKLEEECDGKDFSINANKVMLVSLLQEIDESVSISTIDDIHPMDFQILMEELGKVYDEGGEMSNGDDKKNE